MLLQVSYVFTVLMIITTLVMVVVLYTQEQSRNNVTQRKLDSISAAHSTRGTAHDAPQTLEKSLPPKVSEALHTDTETFQNEFNYNSFETACADPNNFATFRSHPEITTICEHVPLKLCPQYVEQIALYDMTLPWSDICKQDTVGSPTLFDVQYGDLTLRITGVTLRYVMLGLRLLTRLQGRTIDMIEIGGGYGGQSCILFKLANLLNVTINSYTILDLPGVSKLQHRFVATQLNDYDFKKVQFLSINDPNTISKLHKNSFLYSAYAYSEISVEAQKSYTPLKGLVSEGFMVWNLKQTPQPFFYDMIGKFMYECRTEPEYPNTHPTNFFYEW